MKFRKELERDLVPEWRVKYLDYKMGKKKVKAVARAVHRANSTPRTPRRPTLNPQDHSIYGATSPFVPRNKPQAFQDGAQSEPNELRGKAQGSDENARGPVTKKHRNVILEDPNYGIQFSPFLLSPPGFQQTPPAVDRHSFELPDPALATDSPANSLRGISPALSRESSLAARTRRKPPPITIPQNAYEVGKTTSPTHQTTKAGTPNNDRPILRRMFSVGTPIMGGRDRPDVNMVALDQVKARQQEFWSWMEAELEKVENFYKAKEDEAGARLNILREQLHEMRNRRIQEIADAEQSRAPSMAIQSSQSQPQSRFYLVEKFVGQAKATILGPHLGSNSRALQSMKVAPTPQFKSPANGHNPPNETRDYVRRRLENEIPYRSAKQKLKAALQEFYRGMELLKAYALLNRTAFRKINKKYDKAVHAQPPLRFMAERVNKAWFVESNILDGYLHAAEDLYAGYFERGNHKVAVGKLRNTTWKAKDQSSNMFCNGLFIGIGAVFSIHGITDGTQLLFDPDPVIRFQTEYILQIYGGYFLALYLFSWFCLDCSVWSRNKINYKFVFEFDPRHDLDWRELAEFPAFLFLLFGLFLWVNFARYGSPEMFIYYPVILIFVTTLIIFMPAPIFFHRSRKWFVYSHWRLLLVGLYPVEFRDFFLGDMYTSLTYFMGDMELFFCLYGTRWHNPTTCSSSHSRLLGFFSALPGIWRALQCIRRYYDTRNAFPHLVNCGKYGMNIVFFTTLSIYRIDKTRENLIIFSTFAALNTIYSSIWDLLMDWSLLQPGANKPLLRDVRGFKSTWWYYTAMVLDPILRCNWMFYSIYDSEVQYSTVVSFFIAFSEVNRRGMWTLFRVENEHCSNVAHFKASRDVPLPYDIEAGREESETSSLESDGSSQVSDDACTGGSTAAAPPHSESDPYVGKRTTRTFSKIFADAHMQDFEKKKTPNQLQGHGLEDLRSEDEDEDEQDEQDVLDARDLVRRREAAGRGEGGVVDAIVNE